MRSEVDDLLSRCGGVACRADLLRVLTRNQVDDEIARRHLVAPFPRAYCRPWDADQPEVLDRAALVSVGQPVALSHLTALRRLGLVAPNDGRIHLTVPARRHPHSTSNALAVHRTRTPTPTNRIAGLVTVTAEVAVVRSWPLCAGPDQRAPAIEAVRRRLTTPAGLCRELDGAVGLPGRGDLRQLITLLGAGCESELEIWGFLDVFDVPGLRHGMRQLWVRTRAGNYRVDLGYEEERVAIEMDGDRWHSTRQQRERDRRRDAALAAIGWLTLRFSHERLHDDPAGCRSDTLAALAVRRAWRRSG